MPWQAKAVATLRRICTSARGAVVEQSLIVVSRTVHCLTRTIIIAHEGTYLHIFLSITFFYYIMFQYFHFFHFLFSRSLVFYHCSCLTPSSGYFSYSIIIFILILLVLFFSFFLFFFLFFLFLLYTPGFVPPQSLIFDECIATLCALGNQMGPRFITFDSLISRSIEGSCLHTNATFPHLFYIFFTFSNCKFVFILCP